MVMTDFSHNLFCSQIITHCFSYCQTHRRTILSETIQNSRKRVLNRDTNALTFKQKCSILTYNNVHNSHILWRSQFSRIITFTVNSHIFIIFFITFTILTYNETVIPKIVIFKPRILFDLDRQPIRASKIRHILELFIPRRKTSRKSEEKLIGSFQNHHKNKSLGPRSL